MERDPEYIELLKSLIDVANAMKGQPRPTANPVPLLNKFFYHAASAYCLSFGTKIPELGEGPPDAGAINMIARAACESCVKFHHIFIDPEDQHERELRYFAWRLNGELKRRRLLQLLPERARTEPQRRNFEQGKRNTDECIKEFTRKLRSNARFQNLPTDRQNGILTNPRFNVFDISDEDMALKAGFSKGWNMQYRVLCDHVHSGGLTTSQIDESMMIEDRFTHALYLVKVAMAFMVNFYIRLFPQVKSALRESSIRLANELVCFAAYPWVNKERDGARD